jgi:hypothetical protein
MEMNLDDDRADPSKMYRDIGKEYMERAGRFCSNSELSGRTAMRREEHKHFWLGV